MAASAKNIDDAYDQGLRRAHLIHFNEALRGLGREGAEWTEKRWIAEREDTILALREICAEHGDNDWPDNLHLRDIIEKHLARYIRSR